MSESIRRTGQDYSKFDSMSTDALNEYLRRDSYLQNSDETVLDEILYIMEVLAERERKENHYNFTDVNDSWISFKENYSVNDNDGKSLYDFDDEPAHDVFAIQGAVSPSSKIAHTHKDSRRGVKALISIAAAICVIIAGTFTAHALGYDLWDAIIVWTKDTFGFETNVDDNDRPTPFAKHIPEELTELDETMSDLGLPNTLIPGYIPEGYKMSDMHCDELSETTNIFCQLSKGSNSIVLLYRVYLDDPPTLQLEKDSYNPEEYEYNGNVYYIMSNMDSYFVSWLSGNTECTILGVQSHDEILKIINSLNPDEGDRK